MNILIDINHPAHVHYFKNLYRKLKQSDNKVVVVTRNKEIEEELLTALDIPFIRRGAGAKSLLGKFFYHLYAVIFIYTIIKKHKIDKVISFMHPYAAQAAYLAGIKSCIYSDTEHAKLHHKFTVPFASKILTPYCYRNNLGKNHVTFKGFMELSYLHPNYFKPNKKVLDSLSYDHKKPITIVRFVSWGAVHDLGYKGLSKADKIKLVKTVSEFSNVFVSSEGDLPDEIKEFNLIINKIMIHELLANSDLFIGESATMASESAILGTPAIYINKLNLGYLEELENKYNMVYNFNEHIETIDDVIKVASDVIKQKMDHHNSIIDDCIDVTEYMYDQIIQ